MRSVLLLQKMDRGGVIRRPTCLAARDGTGLRVPKQSVEIELWC